MPGDCGCCFHPEDEVESALDGSPTDVGFQPGYEPGRPLHESLTEIDEHGLRFLEPGR
jgi:hypothetical protein